MNGSVRARAAHANRNVRVEGAGLARRSGAVRQTRGRDRSGSRPGGPPLGDLQNPASAQSLESGRRHSMRRPSPRSSRLVRSERTARGSRSCGYPLVPPDVSCRFGHDRVDLVDRAVAPRAADAHDHVDVGRSVLGRFRVRVADRVVRRPAVEPPVVVVVPGRFVCRR